MTAFVVVPPEYHTSFRPVSFPVVRVNTPDGEAYSVCCYHNHRLYKVIIIGDSMIDAAFVADLIRNRESMNTPEAFAMWIDRQFPRPINRPDPSAIQRLTH
ncbi:hypothetical protein [Vreelandella sulfidaeris]